MPGGSIGSQRAVDAALSLLEPAAVACRGDDRVGLSIAISLKRIADAFDQPSAKGSVLWWLETLASAASAGRE